MNIHLPAILMFTRGTRFWHTAKSQDSQTRRSPQRRKPFLFWSSGAARCSFPSQPLVIKMGRRPHRNHWKSRVSARKYLATTPINLQSLLNTSKNSGNPCGNPLYFGSPVAAVAAQVMSISVTASRDDQARFQKADAELDQPPHSTQAGFKVPIAIGKLGKIHWTLTRCCWKFYDLALPKKETNDIFWL